MICGKTKMAATPITTMVMTLEESKLKLSNKSPSPPPPNIDCKDCNGTLRKGTVKVKPSWISCDVVPVIPKNLLTASELLPLSP